MDGHPAPDGRISPGACRCVSVNRDPPLPRPRNPPGVSKPAEAPREERRARRPSGRGAPPSSGSTDASSKSGTPMRRASRGRREETKKRAADPAGPAAPNMFNYRLVGCHFDRDGRLI